MRLKDVLVTLDNAPTHCSYKTKDHISKLGLRVMYLPPYWPTFSPVEILFKIVKGKMRSSQFNTSVDFSKESGTYQIFNVLESLNTSKISRIWRLLIMNLIRALC